MFYKQKNIDLKGINFADNLIYLLFSFIRAIRPLQWSKNLLVFAALLFSFQFNLSIFIKSIYGFISFCFISSAIYLFNDIRDISKDKLHPTKRFRPIANGDISILFAKISSIIMGFISLKIAYIISKEFLFIILLYLLIQIAYCLKFKREPLLDIFCIASGFLLRAISGLVATKLDFSPWFILTIGLLALFLAVEKRKAEVILYKKTLIATRDILSIYSLPLLLRYESLLVSGTFISYSLWALGPSLNGASSPWMLITLPLVLMGLFRYQFISDPEVSEKRKLHGKYLSAENPELILIHDKGIRTVILLWLFSVIIVGKFFH